ncbi:MAG: hypothetical protein K5Q00_07005, partial [Gammaproteobacteria bacterium]|nr:hypothetical protein [Gammaproteobacteria bacterium]
EVILCLSTGNAPQECNDSLKKFFEIVIKSAAGINPKKTLAARKKFLKLCPTNNSVDTDQLALNSSKDIPSELPIVTSARVTATAYCKSFEHIAADANILSSCILNATFEQANNSCHRQFEGAELSECLKDVHAALYL